MIHRWTLLAWLSGFVVMGYDIIYMKKAQRIVVTTIFKAAIKRWNEQFPKNICERLSILSDVLCLLSKGIVTAHAFWQSQPLVWLSWPVYPGSAFEWEIYWMRNSTLKVWAIVTTENIFLLQLHVTVSITWICLLEVYLTSFLVLFSNYLTRKVADVTSRHTAPMGSHLVT